MSLKVQIALTKDAIFLSKMLILENNYRFEARISAGINFKIIYI